MKRAFLTVLVALVLAASATALAATATASLQVSVTVDDSCSIATTPLTFPTYNVVGTHYATPDDGTGAVTIRCSTGTVASIGLGGGGNYSGGRHLGNGSGGLLSYSLYQDSARTVPWSNLSPDWLTTPAAPNSNSAGKYQLFWSIASKATTGTNKQYKFEPMQNTTNVDKAASADLINSTGTQS
jgi:spore coat protein U-like protein